MTPTTSLDSKVAQQQAQEKAPAQAPAQDQAPQNMPTPVEQSRTADHQHTQQNELARAGFTGDPKRRSAERTCRTLKFCNACNAKIMCTSIQTHQALRIVTNWTRFHQKDEKQETRAEARGRVPPFSRYVVSRIVPRGTLGVLYTCRLLHRCKRRKMYPRVSLR